MKMSHHSSLIPSMTKATHFTSYPPCQQKAVVMTRNFAKKENKELKMLQHSQIKILCAGT